MTDQPSNVLILCSDEHARSASGCYGHEVVQTPTLDKLATLGQRFTNAYTPSPICIPARACLATGLQIHEHRCWSSAEPYHGQVESWMHRLRDAGHAVVSIGKLHFRSGDDDNGFTEEIAPMYLANDGKGWPQGLLRDPLPAFPESREMALEAGMGDSTYTEYDRRICDETCRWLRRYPQKIKDRPWVLFSSFVSPHFPLTAPKKFYDLYKGREIPPPIGRHEAERPEHPVLQDMLKFWNYDEYFEDDRARLEARRCYYGLTSFLDDNIARVLSALEDSGAGRDTVIIYISDHGEMLGNFGFWTKSVMYEDSAGVPMIMAGRGIPHGINDTLVSLTDVAATVETAVGFKGPVAKEPWQSRPLQAIIDEPDPDRFILSEYHDGGSPCSFYMVRKGPWKYVHYAGGHPAQIFNLETDPIEMRDLFSTGAGRQGHEELHGYLTAILDPEEIAARCRADQASMVEKLGGRAAVEAMASFNHTPIG